MHAVYTCVYVLHRLQLRSKEKKTLSSSKPKTSKSSEPVDETSSEFIDEQRRRLEQFNKVGGRRVHE